MAKTKKTTTRAKGRPRGASSYLHQDHDLERLRTIVLDIAQTADNPKERLEAIKVYLSHWGHTPNQTNTLSTKESRKLLKELGIRHQEVMKKIRDLA